MTPQDLKDWRKRHGFSKADAQAAIGLSIRSLQNYEGGRAIPLYIALACSAYSHGLAPMGNVPIEQTANEDQGT